MKPRSKYPLTSLGMLLAVACAKEVSAPSPKTEASLEQKILAYYPSIDADDWKSVEEERASFRQDLTATADTLARLITARSPTWEGQREEQLSFITVLTDMTGLPLTPALEAALQKAITARGEPSLMAFVAKTKGFENAPLLAEAYRKHHLEAVLHRVGGESPIDEALQALKAVALTHNPVVLPVLMESLAAADDLKVWPLSARESERFALSAAAADALSEYPEKTVIEALVKRVKMHAKDMRLVQGPAGTENAQNLSAHYLMALVGMKNPAAIEATFDWLDRDAPPGRLRQLTMDALNNLRLEKPHAVSAGRLEKFYPEKVLPEKRTDLNTAGLGEYFIE